MPGQKRSKPRKEHRPARDGQALAEYALIVALIAAVCFSALVLLGVPVQGFYNDFNRSF